MWITHSRGLNNKINHVQERALHIFYKDFSTFFEELLAKGKCLTIGKRNLQQLAIEICLVPTTIITLVLKVRLRNGYQKIVGIVFVRHM